MIKKHSRSEELPDMQLGKPLTSDERKRINEAVIHAYNQRTYLEELEESMSLFRHVSYAGDYKAAKSNAEWVLEQKHPKSMTPEERRLAIELCYKVSNYSLLKELRQLDNNDTTTA